MKYDSPVLCKSTLGTWEKLLCLSAALKLYSCHPFCPAWTELLLSKWNLVLHGSSARLHVFARSLILADLVCLAKTSRFGISNFILMTISRISLWNWCENPALLLHWPICWVRWNEVLEANAMKQQTVLLLPRYFAGRFSVIYVTAESKRMLPINYFAQ